MVSLYDTNVLNNARFNVKGNLPFKTHRPKYLMNDPSPTKKTPFRLIKSAKVFVSSFCCSVLEPCDQKQRLLVVLEFGFEGLSNKTAFAGDWELSFMVKHGETRKTVGYQKAPTPLPPSTPLLSGHFLHKCSESPFPSRPHSTRDPNYP